MDYSQRITDVTEPFLADKSVNSAKSDFSEEETETDTINYNNYNNYNNRTVYYEPPSIANSTVEDNCDVEEPKYVNFSPRKETSCFEIIGFKYIIATAYMKYYLHVSKEYIVSFKDPTYRFCRTSLNVCFSWFYTS